MLAASKPMTLEEFLEFERRSETRHEFVDGRVLAMAGESRQHYAIARNITRALEDSHPHQRCEIVMETIKVRVQEQRYRYPDVVVSCNPGTNRYFLDNPCLLVEVLSDSTADTDQDKKLEEYMRLPRACLESCLMMFSPADAPSKGSLLRTPNPC